MIVVTGATGKLGRLVVDRLLERLPAAEVVVAVRSPAKAADLAERGVEVRVADYDEPATLDRAFARADRLLLISGNELGQRVQQHANVIAAARKAGVCLLAYTSMLHADSSLIGFAEEHAQTEHDVRTSGLPFVFLRNGWYLENYTESLGPALEHGAIFGCAGDGHVAAAARADYAAAAVTVLTGAGHENKIYELAGDTSFTMSELAAEVSRQAGRPVVYRELSPDQHRDLLLGLGVPPQHVAVIVEADLGVARGELDSRCPDLSRLIRRATTSLSEALRAALARLPSRHEAQPMSASPPA